MEYNVFQNNEMLENLRDKKCWQLYNLLDLFKDDTKNALKIKKEDYLIEGKYPIVDQGQTYIGGYTDNEEGLYKKIPSIIFGDHTKIIKYIDFPVFIGADGVKLLKRILGDSELNVKYVYFYLKSIKLPSDGYSRHFKYLKQLVIPLPSIKVQNSIVSILDKANELIEERKSQMEAIDELVKSKFIEMFGDPITNPKGWNTCELRGGIKEIKYGTSTPPIFSEEGIPFVRATNIKGGRIIKNDMKYISEEEASKIQKCKLELGDTIIVRSGANTGDNAFVTDEYVGAYGGYDIIFKLNDKFNYVFINAVLNSTYRDIVINPLTRRAGQPHLNSEQIQSLVIFEPPIELQNQFADFVKQVDKLKFEMDESLKELERNFNSLMQKAFKGELF